MISFQAAPSVPLSYSKLSPALNRSEIREALKLGYVAKHVDPSNSICNDKALNIYSPIGPGLDDWRNRMFLVWFCYLVENFEVLRKPLAALEEILFELEGGPLEFDAEMPRLASLYAGAAARVPLSQTELRHERESLNSYYDSAAKLLNKLNAR